ncbi:hypothetical protein B0H14DRAFT_3092881 [Mycena olivaceomarginata]|nr:hypothetical protein B0H14DRAFT_3092881 [Mycena olivaceomarginata]
MAKQQLKRKAGETIASHVVFHNPKLRRLHYTVTTKGGSLQSTATTVLARQSPVPVIPSPPPIPPAAKPSSEYFNHLANLLLEYEADSLAGCPCGCGRSGMIADVQCHDCIGYRMSCKACFVEEHIHSPFHWAEVWDTTRGFFVRHDISKLDHVIQLGHQGEACPSPSPVRLFTVIESNGLHSTKLAFCGCREQPPDKIGQLMRARLFPATTRDPHSAFTISMLKQFQLHNLESKKAAYDYLGAIRRLTDNSFTADIPVTFLRVVRVFNFLTLKKRSGQFHGIDVLLPHRPSGNLLVWCPACPEPGFNSDLSCPKTPRYFPENSEYQSFLKSIPVSQEKSTCNYLRAVNKQDKKKFKNMAITGTINCQCSHVFVLSCVDLYYGERFANADKALAIELEKYESEGSFEVTIKLQVDDIDELTTYDIACAYCVNLEKRFEASFPHLSHLVKRMRWGVPALHVQGHQESCIYLFGTAYMDCAAHFHGETAEQYWSELNQLGPHVRQMNNGHRQDTLINHHGDWNYKKLAKIAGSLADNLKDAALKYVEKRNHYIALSMSFNDRVSRKRGNQFPSQLAISQKMLSDDDSFASTMIPKSKVAKFLDEALKIEDLQRQLRQLVSDREEHDLVSRQKDITSRTAKLQSRIQHWRKEQKEIMPCMGDRVAAQTLTSPLAQNEQLFLPSDLANESERRKHDLISLGHEEIQWREGQLFDALRALQHIVKPLSTLRRRKIKNERQQKQNSRADDHIQEGIRRRNYHMATYELARQRLITLDATNSTFPPLTEADLYMKSVQQKRQLGDSHRTDGALWRAQYKHANGQEKNRQVNDQYALQLVNRIIPGSRPHQRAKDSSKEDSDDRREGWLWQLGKLSKMSKDELDEWSNEGDRVQWFRAEAEMQRWQEQKEQKLAELLRTNRSFLKMEATWTALASDSATAGHRAYARQKAATYRTRAQQAQNFVTRAGYGESLTESANIIERIQMEREKEKMFVIEAISKACERETE